MRYKVVLFGVKDTSETIVRFLQAQVHPVDLIVTISSKVCEKNQVSGFKGLSVLEEELGIPVVQMDSYSLKDEAATAFFENNEFELGISMGWQRLIPESVLERFTYGVYGFHGSCGYLPYGRGRSPLNWSVILGDSRFILNLFRYDKNADSPNVFAKEMFAINEHDTIRTLQYKNMICSKRLLQKLIGAYEKGEIPVTTDSRDFDLWYGKRTGEDGRVDFRGKTRDIYNLIRGVTAPFPGAFAYAGEEKVILWDAVPFDEMLDFSQYAPGEIIDVFDHQPIVRTVDGSLLIRKYECAVPLVTGQILKGTYE